MTSFQITIAPNRRAAARFITGTRRKIVKALHEEKLRGLTQAQIARALGVHRSVINRELRGKKDLTLGRVAELAWAMGREATLSLPKIELENGSNAPTPSSANTFQQVTSGTSAVLAGNTLAHRSLVKVLS